MTRNHVLLSLKILLFSMCDWNKSVIYIRATRWGRATETSELHSDSSRTTRRVDTGRSQRTTATDTVGQYEGWCLSASDAARTTVSLAEGIAQLETGKKLTQHDSMFDDFSVCGLIMRSSLHEAALRIASRLCVWLSVHPVPISNSRKKRLVWGKNEWKSRMMVTP